MSNLYNWDSAVHAERMSRFKSAGLYLVTSATLSSGRTTTEVVSAALDGGVKLVQLREKDLPVRELMTLAREVRELTSRAGALLIINDRVDVAVAVGADGVHLGQDDLPIDAARGLSADLIIGASSHNEEEARAAEADGASYVNIGPLFPTRTKEWTDAFLGVEGLRRIAPVVTIPFTVMGGIKAHHVPDVCAAGAQTLAVVTAVTAAPDPAATARELVALVLDSR